MLCLLWSCNSSVQLAEMRNNAENRQCRVTKKLFEFAFLNGTSFRENFAKCGRFEKFSLSTGNLP